MNQCDFERASQYAFARLQHELSPAMCYHSLAHTQDDVLPAVERLASLEGIDDASLLLLRTAACYHDIGFVEGREEHERISVRIAREMLPRFGYSPEQIARVGAIILATRLPQAPQSLLGQLLADADLDVLGRNDFLSTNRALRAELAAFGSPVDDATWYRAQLEFLQNHRYFTAAARKLRAATKQHNIALLRELLAACES
jgi:uncharacterized protein